MTDFNSLFSDLNIGGLGKMVKTLNYGRDGLGRPLGSRLEEDKFYFKVAEFSMGSMAPKSDAYYEALSYPTTESNSSLSFHPKTARFSFHLDPHPSAFSPAISGGSVPPPPLPHPSSFRLDPATVPPAIRDLKGEIALEDISTRGISCFRAESTVKVRRVSTRPFNGGGGGGARGRSLSPFSVDSTSSESGESVYGSPPPKRSRYGSPPTSFTPTSTDHRAEWEEEVDKVTFTITMRRPPSLFVPLQYPSGKAFVVEDVERSGRPKDIMTRQGTSRDYNLVVTGEKVGKGERDVGEMPVFSEQEVFKVGEYLSYRFTLLMTSTEHRKLRSLLTDLGILARDVLSPQGIDEFNSSHLRTHGINHGSNGTRNDVVPIISIRSEYLQRRRLSKPLKFPNMDWKLIEKNLNDVGGFETRFLVEGLVSHGIILPAEMDILMKKLKEIIPLDDRKRLAKSLGRAPWGYDGPWKEDPVELRARVLNSFFLEDRIKDIGSLLRKRARNLARHGNPPKPPSHLCKVFRCAITPTRILLFPGEWEVSNTILRRYEHHSDRFLRMSFTDEDDRIKMNPIVRTIDKANESTGTVARVRRAMQHGLNVAGRHYVFLAASTSQAREHGCWFVSEVYQNPRPLLASSIRSNMGSIKERVVAKYAARLGLAFSTTREVRNAKGEPIKFDVADRTKDVKRGKYMFTDGAGLCSANVARAAARSLGHYSGPDSNPSTIQVRIGGAKGVLTVWPWMVKYQYSVRQSMEKFSSPDRQVNVIRISRFSYAFLNRQFIVLMHELGIREEIFIELFKEAVKEVKGMASRIAAGTHTSSDVKRGDELSTWPVRTMVEYGFQRDACLQDLLKVIECRSLSDLRWRARLQIKKGVYLLGIPDELEILKEGEVFCRYQLPDDPDEDAQVVTGACIICRAPALHPGDIRRVKAVDRPQLHHLRNVIVFSVKGERDLPNMLGGGDLDGDDYSLIWDPRLIHNYDAPPMNYDAPPPIQVDRVTDQDLIENFVSYLKNDILGQVDNAHLAWAAHQYHGPRSEKCISLAEIHSKAVDFAKTGDPADMTADLRPQIWPDFMNKGPHISYKCDNVLGKLFRIIDQDPRFKPASEDDIKRGVDMRLCKLAIPPYVLDQAVEMKEQYDTMLWDVLLRYRITEAEAYSGMVLKNGKRRKMKDHDLKDPVREAFQEVVRHVREEGDYRLGDREFQHTLNSTQLLAVACYQITFDDRYKHLGGDPDEGHSDDEQEDEEITVLDEDWESPIVRPKRLISFGWLYGKEILALPIITGYAEQVEDD